MTIEDLDAIVFDDADLVPAIVQDATTLQVLMLAYMNPASLAASIEEGRTVFWSRSRQELWRKGSTSGDVQHVRSIRYDCDGDTLLIMVDQAGRGACHTGAPSCFFNHLGPPPSETGAP